MSDKKKMQLGMNPSTASHRLVKDVLWSLVSQTGQSACCKCGELMSRETFSIEHVTPWLDSDDPVGLYFDLTNISFSHLKCNIADSRGAKKHATEEDRRNAKNQWHKDRPYCPERRREQYQRTGK